LAHSLIFLFKKSPLTRSEIESGIGFLKQSHLRLIYAPEHERAIAWDDPDLNISWPLQAPPLISDKDRQAVRFREAEVYP